jgi:hypothetical protein
MVFISFFVSCTTTRVKVVDGYIIESQKILSLRQKPDTVYYKTLWSGEVITQKEYDERWDKALKNARKKIEKQNKN